MGASKTKTFLGSRYRRIVTRRGKQRALVAVGNSILTVAYYLVLPSASSRAGSSGGMRGIIDPFPNGCRPNSPADHGA